MNHEATKATENDNGHRAGHARLPANGWRITFTSEED